MTPTQFSNAILKWFDKHGRHDLPWQQKQTAYRVWVSEIMLQQTQVATVIPYYEGFMQTFPDVQSLARAAIDEVLHLWTGLGYYARARNLHKTAQLIVSEHKGEFPQAVDEVMALPGIGRSTAGAILALACNQYHAILDGNVKRVLSRFYAVEGWPGQKNVEQQLWQHAESCTPKKRTADYTQAIMDLGATLCTRSKPRCHVCPVNRACIAYGEDRITDFPAKKPKKTMPVKHTTMLMLRHAENAAQVLLQQRPPSGIWGGLWSFPQADIDADDKQALQSWCKNELGLQVKDVQAWPVMRHTFSHFHLEITPVEARLKDHTNTVMESAQSVWYNTAKPDARGLAAPVKRLLEAIHKGDLL
jgi:A/G-specific adenine glycosylase